MRFVPARFWESNTRSCASFKAGAKYSCAKSQEKTPTHPKLQKSAKELPIYTKLIRSLRFLQRICTRLAQLHNSVLSTATFTRLKKNILSTSIPQNLKVPGSQPQLLGAAGRLLWPWHAGPSSKVSFRKPLGDLMMPWSIFRNFRICLVQVLKLKSYGIFVFFSGYIGDPNKRLVQKLTPTFRYLWVKHSILTDLNIISNSSAFT